MWQTTEIPPSSLFRDRSMTERMSLIEGANWAALQGPLTTCSQEKGGVQSNRRRTPLSFDVPEEHSVSEVQNNYSIPKWRVS